MKIYSKRVRKLALAGVAAAGFCQPVAALAQATETADQAPTEDQASDGLADIIVTAQKRSENNQTTPIAISVLSDAALTDRHVQSLVDLGDGAIPSLRIAPFFSRPGALIINVRGIGVLSDSNQPARDQGVGVYVDGVYLGRAQGLGTALYDVENIEVLKGPQGTLFGRNTEGGAVSIVTKRPSGKFKMNTTFGVGNYGAYQASTHIDLPEAANISLKFDGVITYRGPFVSNPQPGALGFNSYDKRGLRFEALWKPARQFQRRLCLRHVLRRDQHAVSAVHLRRHRPSSDGDGGGDRCRVALPIFPTSSSRSRASFSPIGVPQQASVGITDGLRLGLDWDVAPKLTIKSITVLSPPDPEPV